MEYRKLGKTDIEISAMAFGAWAIGGWMWGGADEQEALAAMRRAYDVGITTIDTAPVYGFGKSESLVGQVLKELPRDKVQILTKFGLRWDTRQGVHYFDSTAADGTPVQIHRFGGRDGVIWECEQSLRRLGTDYLDLFQIHWPDVSTPISETMEALERLLEQGKIRAAGVCNYFAEDMQQALDVLPIASNQVPYSMVKRDIEEAVVPLALQEELSILAYSPLQRGLLTGKIGPDYHFESGDHRPATPYFKSPNREHINAFLQTLGPLAQEKGASLAQLVIQWTIRQPGITCALVGARNIQQVEDNVGAFNFSLSAEEIARINGKLNKLVIEA